MELKILQYLLLVQTNQEDLAAVELVNLILRVEWLEEQEIHLL